MVIVVPIIRAIFAVGFFLSIVVVIIVAAGPVANLVISVVSPLPPRSATPATAASILPLTGSDAGAGTPWSSVATATFSRLG